MYKLQVCTYTLVFKMEITTEKSQLVKYREELSCGSPAPKNISTIKLLNLRLKEYHGRGAERF